jgi:hypothetical protein
MTMRSKSPPQCPVPFFARLIPVFFTLAALSCLDPIKYPQIDPAPDPPPVTISLDGIRPVTGEERKESIFTTDFIGVISWTPSVPKTGDKYIFESFKDYSAVISLGMLGGRSIPPAGTTFNVGGAISAAYNANAGTITAAFPRTHRPVDSVNDLNNAVSALASLPPADYAANSNVIELTAAFYADANTTNTFVTIGAAEAGNTVPYTVRGLGKYSANALKVGVLLANNNITLEDMRIAITDTNRGVPHQWSGSSYYRSAVSVGHYKGPPAVGTSNYASSPASKNVTVRNCNISFAVSDSMIAGVYILGSRKEPLRDISIVHNEIRVEATNNSDYAAQALLALLYAPSLSITGNGLEAKNTPSTHNRPAGALFMQIDPDIDPDYTPRISGNTINGKPTYDFYINILSTGDRAGIKELVDNKFATPKSTWMTAKSTDTGPGRSFYKKLVEALLPQIRDGNGYGYLALYLDGAKYSTSDCVFEAYERRSKRLFAIDFWGYTINNNKYDISNNAANEVRARLLIDDSNAVYSTDKFCWYPGDTSGANIPPAP